MTREKNNKEMKEDLTLSRQKLFIIERSRRLNKSNRRSLVSTVFTVCFAGFLGLAGIYVAWVRPSVWVGTIPILDNLHDSFVSNLQCSQPSDVNRFDCWPEEQNATKEKCEARGCCWIPLAENKKVSTGVPYCFYPKDFHLFSVQDLRKSTTGMTAQLVSNGSSGWPNDIKYLQIDIVYETSTQLHFKIYDSNNKRYEVPVNVSKVDNPVPSTSTDYVVEVPSQGPFYITVKRKSSGKILFSSKSVAPLIFADQFLQFGTQLSSQFIYGLGEHMDKFAINIKWKKFSSKSVAPLIFADQFIQLGTQLSSQFIYGLGEHMDKFAIDIQWKKYVMWARDEPPTLNANLYGSHPFYLNIEEDHNAHGVFLLNSNAMEIEFQETPALTYRTTGGILDFYIFTGPTPDSVVEQYTGLIGRSFMPPYWALGFHLCRWGYGSSDEVQKVIKRMREAKMPYDTQWTDIDYMRSHLDWTYDAEGKFPGLPDIVKDLHDHGQHYIPIIDPGISNVQKPGSYPPYDEGLKQNIFIKKQDGSNDTGRCWPGSVAFPDFFHPNATKYWTEQAKSFHDIVPFDGLWTDMNEPSNGVDGSVDGCPSTSLDDPPFTPPGMVGGDVKSRSLCPSSKQYLSTHYNLHSLYGHSEVVVTKRALDIILGNKRSIIISRSTFPTTGVHGGHWLGDNNAEWDHTYYSITGMLSFQLFGIPLVGADICGFGGNTTPELCARWMQLGAFYPFMRNHNVIGAKDQDPAVFDEATQDIMRTALQIRYSLLPYLYTLFFQTHMNGTAIVRPLFFQYPESDNNVIYTQDTQFMWGTSLLITPVTTPNTTQGQGYLPKDRWYDFYDFTYVDSPGHFVMFSLPMEHTNIQVRGGSIIPMQEPDVTTTLARKNNFRLLVALSPQSMAFGQLFWDDGESRDSISGQKYNLIHFQVYNTMLTSVIVKSGYSKEPMVLGAIRIMGVTNVPKFVTLNGGAISTYTYQDQCLYIFDQNINLLKEFYINWQPSQL